MNKGPSYIRRCHHFLRPVSPIQLVLSPLSPRITMSIMVNSYHHSGLTIITRRHTLLWVNVEEEAVVPLGLWYLE